MSESNKTLILGSGPCARNIAENLLSKGEEIVLVTQAEDAKLPSAEKAEILRGTTLVTCRGAAGDFKLTLSNNGERFSRTAAYMIVAEEAVRRPNFSLYGLESSSHVISLSQLKESLSDKERFSSVRHATFLTGLATESDPVTLREMMESSLRLRSDFDIRAYILTKNLKVGGNGLEALYRTTRSAGTVYVKFTGELPDIHQADDGRVTLTFMDEITRERFSLNPDMTIVDETLSPSDYATDLARILELNTDPSGFLQSDNVHRFSLLTNRRGILVAGPSRSVQSADDQAMDEGNAAISILKLRADQPEDKAVIGPGCARCLTCYRVCPYRAIQIAETRPTVTAEACEGCGLCAAVCPACAITIKGLTREDISERIAREFPKQEKMFIPYLVAFCCKRSAVLAQELAMSSYVLPHGLMIVEVPCAGSVSHEHIFSAFKNRADGVLVLTCHEGNCHSEYGNLYARKQAEQMATILSDAGFEKERLLIETLAANMGKEFSEITMRFKKKILELGPSRLS